MQCSAVLARGWCVAWPASGCNFCTEPHLHQWAHIKGPVQLLIVLRDARGTA